MLLINVFAERCFKMAGRDVPVKPREVGKRGARAVVSLSKRLMNG